MPSSKIKNLAYRFLLPFQAPCPDPNPFCSAGHKICNQTELTHILRRNRVLGGALLLSGKTDSTLVLTSCATTGQKALESTFFRVASITKMATAVVALKLCDDQLLDPAAPVSSYLPESKNVKELEGITLIHLLSHTSGLSDPGNLEQMLESSRPYYEAVSGSRFAAPGSLFRYSNLGFGLVGCILESVSGMPVSRLFAEKLFQPLGMNATLEGCSLPADQIMPVIRIMPYKPGSGLTITNLGKKPLAFPDPLHHYGHTAGSMYTDIRSLSLLLACIRDGGAPVLSAAMNEKMKQQHAVYGSISPTLSYGLGLLFIRDRRLSSSRILGHQGFAYGCADGAFWEESTGNVMIILNGSCSEARVGRLGLCNRDLLRWAFRKELPQWQASNP